MKSSAKEALTAYYKEAGSWADDRSDALRRSRRIAWIIAACATAVALFEAVALVALTPLKTVVPYTLLVDRTTGYVQALKPLDASTVTPDRALTQSLLVQYVIAREGFDATTLQADYRKVGLWSVEQARAGYVEQMRASNPASPLNRLSRSSRVEVRVKSVSPLSGRTALVRFDTLVRDAGGGTLAPRPWVSVISYRFSGEPMSAEDRFSNPLGFQVSSYRRDPEALPPSDDAAPVSSMDAP